MFCCIYLTICDRQVLLKYFIDKYYWDILTGSYLCFYFYPIFGKERPHMILRNMSKSVLTVDCFCHPLVMLHRWLEKSRSVMLGHLKNLAASSLAISENGSVWEWPQRLRNVLSQKNSPKNLQNADAARSQTCTFTMDPGSVWCVGIVHFVYHRNPEHTQSRLLTFIDICWTFIKCNFSPELGNLTH